MEADSSEQAEESAATRGCAIEARLEDSAVTVSRDGSSELESTGDERGDGRV